MPSGNYTYTWADSTTWTGYTATTTASTSLGYPSGVSATPRKKSPLEWLDAEVERTCALARAA